MEQSRVLLIDDWDLGPGLLERPSSWDLQRALATKAICPSPATTHLHYSNTERNELFKFRHLRNYMPFRACHGFTSLLLRTQYLYPVRHLNTSQTIISFSHLLPPGADGAARKFDPDILHKIFLRPSTQVSQMVKLPVRSAAQRHRVCVHLRFGDYDKASAMFLDLKSDLAKVVAAIKNAGKDNRMDVVLLTDYFEAVEQIRREVGNEGINVLPPVSIFPQTKGSLGSGIDQTGHSTVLALAELMQCSSCTTTIGTYKSTFSAMCETSSRIVWSSHRRQHDLRSCEIASSLCSLESASKRNMDDCPHAEEANSLKFC
jgi:hypothetical protein